MSSDLWVITSYFNPARFATKRRNFDAFMAGMDRAAANVLVAELAFGSDPFELEPGSRVIQLRGGDVMWQKERLLNIAAARLPGSCRKVAWLDADILFDEPDWLQRTSEALETHVVVQPFSQAVRLGRDNREVEGVVPDESFAACFARDPSLAKKASFFDHGHTGYAWAARRELFDRCGLYDACLTGANDHLMAHLFAGSALQSHCIRRTIGDSPAFADHFRSWAYAAWDVVGGSLGLVAGRIRHRWHGEVADRRYSLLDQQFKTFGFDPAKHLRHDAHGLWEWADAPASMRSWAAAMFDMRKEDGDRAEPDAAALHGAAGRVA